MKVDRIKTEHGVIVFNRGDIDDLSIVENINYNIVFRLLEARDYWVSDFSGVDKVLLTEKDVTFLSDVHQQIMAALRIDKPRLRWAVVCTNERLSELIRLFIQKHDYNLDARIFGSFADAYAWARQGSESPA